ncbi:MAG: hypothetical protein RIS79_1280 [Verrucomicrobiota bacterium]
MQCQLHDAPMCVCNLVNLTDEHAPISFGLRLGLNHLYGEDHVPPCVHGPLGASYWSVQSAPGEPELVHQ